MRRNHNQPNPLRFSVAMCTFNGGPYLQQQLASILAQTRPPAEVVISDDGSTDETIETLYEFKKDASFPVHIFRNALNLGYSRNFAHAIELCAGDLIALCDQDDWWYPHKLEQLHQEFDADAKAGGIFSDGDLINAESRPLPGTLWKSFSFGQADWERVNAGDGVRVLLRRNAVTGMTLAFRSTWRGVLRQMPQLWPHDFWLALMLAEDNALRACPDRLVAYRVHEKQQIGVPITRTEKVNYFRRHGLSAYLKLSRERNQANYSRDAMLFESLIKAARSADIDHLSQSNPLGERWWMQMAEQKAQHMHRGALQLQHGRARRCASALYHWKSYRDYAPTGLSALLRDLML